MEGQPITTNPVLIMAINMTIVFGVLISLWGVINLIHYFDPTKKKEVKQEAAPAPAPVVQQAAPAVAAAQPVEAQEDDKTIKAVITTAIMASGCKEFEIKSINKL